MALQIGLGIGGLLVSLLLAWALIGATRRQTAHFRSLVTASTDLVLVFGPEGCRYASASVADAIGRTGRPSCSATGFARHVHPDDLATVRAARRSRASRGSSCSGCRTGSASGGTSSPWSATCGATATSAARC